MAIETQSICCINDAGFVMNFWIEWIDSDGNPGWTRTNSGDYPIDQRRTLDLDALNRQGESIPVGAFVRPRVQAELGDSNSGDKYVLYQPGLGNTVSYDVTGTTLNYSVTRID
ncbi:MAG TPA: hypothetical protein VEH81_15745 [Ktedonobacteraceae bacterium]|nr:hypothetical protein [Ktedonobacteraceae bacterium]HXZ06287.1 hypothetical protein [Ktedonobacteraceae bacterium]HYB01055.1 hypothetical protein [Ktedonobacteraceae bacterium]